MWGDDAKRFLERVHNWPASDADAGVVNLHWTKPNKKQGAPPYMNGNAYRDVDAFVSHMQWRHNACHDTRDIYHCTSLQKTTARGHHNKPIAMRNIQNTLTSKTIFLDIDVKAAPKGYPNLNTALGALADFVAHYKLPRPSAIVASGGGAHIYWCSNRPLDQAEWRPYAVKLRDAAAHFGLLCDLGVTIDMTRLLRVPETSNWKTTPPKPVSLLYVAKSDYDFATELKPILDAVPAYAVAAPAGAAPKPAKPPAAPLFDPKVFVKRDRPAIFASVPNEASAGITREHVPLDPKPILEGCGFLREGLKTGGKDHGQDLWMLAVLCTVFMQDGRALAHDLSSGYPSYTREETDRMYDRKENDHVSRDIGWPSCAKIEAWGCKECALCPHRGKITSPMELGKTVQVTVPGNPEPARHDVLAWPIPLHFPFQRNEDGYICVLQTEEDADGVECDKLIPLLYKQHMFSPSMQHAPDVLRFKIDGSNDGLRDVKIDRKFVGSTKMADILCEQGVAVNRDQSTLLGRFFMTLMREMEQALNIIAAKPFGWVDTLKNGDMNAFVYGGTIFHRDGTETVGGYLDDEMMKQHKPRGKREVGLKALQFILDQQQYDQIVMTACMYAAPLMEFTIHHAVLFSDYSSISGKGKSTGLKVGGSIWGHPDDSRLSQGATENSVGHKMGILANLPILLDELSNPKSQAAVFAMLMQDGKERERLIALTEGLKLRASGTWSTLFCSTSNRSFLEFLDTIQKDTNAGRMRVFEVTPQLGKSFIPPHVVDAMMLELNVNYGIIGLEYAKFLAINSAKIKQIVQDRALAFHKKVKTQQAERLWATFCTVVLVGAQFAKDNGWTDYDMEKLEEYLIEQFMIQRRNVTVSGNESKEASLELLNGFLKEHMPFTITTDDFQAGGGRNRPCNILSQPLQQHSKGIYIHFVHRKLNPVVMISRRRLDDWLIAKEHQPGVIMSRIPHTKAREVTLGRGSFHASQRERVYEIPLLPDFTLEGAPLDEEIVDTVTDAAHAETNAEQTILDDAAEARAKDSAA